MSNIEEPTFSASVISASIACKRQRKINEESNLQNVTDDNKNDINFMAKYESKIMHLPNEIHLEILGYLSPRDLQIIRQVSTYFENLVRDPTLWKYYEISKNEISTSDVISDLKRMPFLKKICISNRVDCDKILSQVALSNKNLEELYVSNCLGSRTNLFLRPGYLTRILERCCRLHTISFRNTRFRGHKFFRLLAEAGPRLREVKVSTTPLQLTTFTNNVTHISNKDRELIGVMCNAVARNSWVYLKYTAIQHNGQPNTILISFYNRMMDHILTLSTVPVLTTTITTTT